MFNYTCYNVYRTIQIFPNLLVSYNNLYIVSPKHMVGPIKLLIIYIQHVINKHRRTLKNKYLMINLTAEQQEYVNIFTINEKNINNLYYKYILNAYGKYTITKKKKGNKYKFWINLTRIYTKINFYL